MRSSFNTTAFDAKLTISIAAATVYSATSTSIAIVSSAVPAIAAAQPAATHHATSIRSIALWQLVCWSFSNMGRQVHFFLWMLGLFRVHLTATTAVASAVAATTFTTTFTPPAITITTTIAIAAVTTVAISIPAHIQPPMATADIYATSIYTFSITTATSASAHSNSVAGRRP